MKNIGKIGIFISGKNKGWQIRIEDVTKSTGGYLILTSKDFSNPKAEAYDDWVENNEMLEQYFKESNFDIEWK